jgi:hypothetical protein
MLLQNAQTWQHADAVSSVFFAPNLRGVLLSTTFQVNRSIQRLRPPEVEFA